MLAQSSTDEERQVRLAIIGDSDAVRRLASMVDRSKYSVDEFPGTGSGVHESQPDIVLAAECPPLYAAEVMVPRVLARQRDRPVVAVTADERPESVRRAIASGALDAVPGPSIDATTLDIALERVRVLAGVRAEHERRRNDLRRAVTMLESRNQRLLESISHLEELVRTDELTGLANRRWLNLVLEGVWAESLRNDLPLAVMMLDLDRFKTVNDHHGHARGDEVLRFAARLVDANCRDVDTKARLGGDEFCVLLPHTTLAEAESVAQRICDEFAQAVERGVVPPGVGISIGVAHNQVGRAPSAAALVARADEALYRAKAVHEPVVVWSSSVRPAS